MIEKFIENRRKLWLHIYHKTNKDRPLTEDLIQDLFIKIHRIDQAGQYQDQGKFMSWCKRVATNMVMDHYRKESRSKIDLVEEKLQVINQTAPKGMTGVTVNAWNSLKFATEDQEHEDTFVTDEMREKLMEALGELPEKQRELLISRYFRNMTYNEIVLETGEKLENLLPRHHYTIKKLRKQFGCDRD